jgi:hypothetical protein
MTTDHYAAIVTHCQGRWLRKEELHALLAERGFSSTAPLLYQRLRKYVDAGALRSKLQQTPGKGRAPLAYTTAKRAFDPAVIAQLEGLSAVPAILADLEQLTTAQLAQTLTHSQTNDVAAVERLRVIAGLPPQAPEGAPGATQAAAAAPGPDETDSAAHSPVGALVAHEGEALDELFRGTPYEVKRYSNGHSASLALFNATFTPQGIVISYDQVHRLVALLDSALNEGVA